MAINVVSDTTVSAAEIIEELLPQFDDLVTRGAATIEDNLADNWHHAVDIPGQKSRSTGTSAAAISVEGTVTPHSIIIDFQIEDDVNPLTGQPASEYAKYVHENGGSAGPPGDALVSATNRFNRDVEELSERLFRIARNAYERTRR